VFRRALTALLAATAAGSMLLALSGVAQADDAHNTCTNTLACTGNIADVHDITTTVSNVLNGLHILGQ